MRFRLPPLRAMAFLTRSIRQESRLVSHHVMRGSLTIVVLLLFAMQLSTSSLFSAAGNRFVGSIIKASYWFLTFVSLLYFSVAITEEKEEDTLPLLRMTGVSNLALLIGKSIPRLAVTVLFLLVVTPFLTLSITMGGVVPEQLISSVLGLLCYSFLLSQLGLFASTVSYDGRRAFSTSLILWFAFEFGHYVLWIAGMIFQQNRLLATAAWLKDITGWLSERTMFSSMDSYLMLDRGDPVWFSQMTWHLIAGFSFMGLSWLLFERFNSRAIGQGIAAESSRKLVPAFSSRLSARSTGNALVWKSWHFLLGGKFWFVMRLMGLPVLYVMLVFFIGVMVDEFPEPSVYAVVMMIASPVMLLLDLARVLGRVLNEEVYRQTLVSLKMIPISTRQMVTSLVLGTLPVLIPPVTCFGLGTIVLGMSEPSSTTDFAETLQEPWFLHLFTWVLVTLHFGVLMSVYLRYGGMVLAAAMFWIGSPILFVMFLTTFRMFFGAVGIQEEMLLRYLVPISLMIAECVVCVLLQQMVIRRVDTLAEQ